LCNLPPLDGGRIVGSLLPDVLARPYMKLEPYGIFILLFLIATGAFSHVFEPLFAFFVSWL
jgi:Zn-dependent protease